MYDSNVLDEWRVVGWCRYIGMIYGDYIYYDWILWVLMYVCMQ